VPFVIFTEMCESQPLIVLVGVTPNCVVHKKVRDNAHVFIVDDITTPNTY